MATMSPDTPERRAEMKPYPYRELAGKMLYLAIATRPDIGFTLRTAVAAHPRSLIDCAALANTTNPRCAPQARLAPDRSPIAKLDLVHSVALTRSARFVVRDLQHRPMTLPSPLFCPFLTSPFIHFRRLHASLNHVFSFTFHCFTCIPVPCSPIACSRR
jgi:hypothetical protein